MGTLEIAKGTLLNTQVQIQTSSNNIANAENKSYARQKAVVKSNPAVLIYPNWLGTGADVTTVTQIRDQYIEQRLMGAISDESKYGELASQLETVQAVFSDTGDTGISQSLNAFWNSWDSLSQNPTGVAQQTDVYQATQNLAQTIQSAYTQLDDSATQITSKIDDTVSQAKDLVDQIAQLNAAILKNETASHPANDLRDQRYQALKDLSAIIPVNTSEDANGIVTVTTEDGSATGILTLVTGGTVNNYITSTSTITGGSFGGLQQALTDVNGYMDRLDDFAGQLITQANAIHGAGATAVFSGSDAQTITASTTFLNGQTAAVEAPLALAMAGLQGTPIAFTGKTATFNQYLGDLQKQIGTDAQQATTQQTFNKALRTQLDAQQQSISGVSIDEEMVDMIQFQHIYEAAAKVVQKAAEMLDTVINMVQ